VRSRAAAQLLSGKGFKDVYTLNGGINAWEGNTSESPVEMGMMLLRGDETPEEIILLAYGMEKELETFYSVMSGKTDDTEAAKLFSMLSEIEEKHKEKLFKLYLDLDKSITGREAFEAKIESGTMEGGFTTEEFIEKNSNFMKTVPGIIDLAMMLETQALDLYLRYTQKISDNKGKAILFGIADEEKAHLAALGVLLDTKI